MHRFLNFYHNHKTLISITLLALLIRLIFFFLLKPWDAQVVQDRILRWDALEYHQLALEILRSGNFDHFGVFRTPLYPVFIAFAYFIFGIKPWIVLLIQIFVNIITGLMAYKIGKELFNKKIAVIATIVFFIDLHIISNCLEVLTDTIFTAFLVGTVLTLILGIKNNKKIYFLACGFLLAMATLTRPISQFFPFIVLIVLFSYPYFKLRKKLIYFSIFFIVFFLSLFPWFWRNYTNYGRFKLSSISELTLYGNIIRAEAMRSGDHEDIIKKKLNEQLIKYHISETSNLFYVSSLRKRIALDYVKNNLTYFTKVYFGGIGLMYVGFGTSAIADLFGFKSNKLTSNIFHKPSIGNISKEFITNKSFSEIAIAISVAIYLLIIYSMFFYGCYLMVNEKKYFSLWLIILILVYFSLLSGTFGYYRYRLPVIPFYLLISAKGIGRIIDYSERNGR